MDRRHFLARTACAAALGSLATPTRARVNLGERTLETLSDGHLTLPADFIFGPMDKEKLSEVLDPFDMKPEGRLTPPCNVTLLRDAERTVLFDTGAGPAFQDSAGELLDALDALDLSPEDITHVVFTHGHPDHLWGVLDDFDDPLFPEAEHMMGRAEFDYWMAKDTVNTIGDARAAFAAGALRRLEAIEDAITLFDDGEEILPGVAAHLTPGHTPGHVAFEVRSGSESAMIVGDAIGNHHVAFARPDWHSGSDQDEPLAAKTRARLLDRLSAEKMRLIGFHLPDGGIGRAERSGSSYRFVPEIG